MDTGTLNIALALVLFIAVPIVIGIAIVGSAQLVNRFRAARNQSVAGLVCRLDSDCPEGYICWDGVCIMARA